MSLHNWRNTKILVEDTSNYMNGQDFDIVEEARGKKIADPLRAKLMGMEDIRGLKGTMTPRYFATKVIKFLQRENPEQDIDDLSDDEIQNAINVVANVSKPLSTRPDVSITTRKRGSADAGLKKGDSGFETLQLNLGSDAVLDSQGEVGNNDLYTTIKDGLKYRVTVNSFKGTKVSLDDIKQDDIVSVVIVKPSEMETVDKFGGEIEMGQREKLVADFPEGEEDDMGVAVSAVRYMSQGDQFGTPPEDEIDYKKADIDNDGKVSEYEHARAKAAFGDDDEDAENPKQIHHLDKDLDDDGEITDYEKARGEAIDKAMKKERERAGQDHARSVADYYQDDNEEYTPDESPADDNLGDMEPFDDEEEERCPVTGKLRKKKSESEEEEQVAMSPQQMNNYLLNQYRQKMQNAHSQERLHRHGY
tara:strand:+ start:2070 stop:3326 length:1257 start_codon:yes stop_codon:yes gene_type:complete